AFAFTFYLLFRPLNDSVFGSIGQSILKTVVMLTGEFDYNSIDFEPYVGYSHVVFVVFLFLIALVLANLLTGLAVSDMGEIQCEAEVLALVSRVKLVAKMEA